MTLTLNVLMAFEDYRRCLVRARVLAIGIVQIRQIKAGRS